MARGRMLSTSIAEDVAVNSLSLEAHWLYMMTIPHLDRDGLIKADRFLLFGKVCPRRPEFIEQIDNLIAEWERAELVLLYTTREGRIAYFRGFGKNQVGMAYSREPASKLDPPPGYERTDRGLECNAENTACSLHADYMQSTCNVHADYKKTATDPEKSVREVDHDVEDARVNVSEPTLPRDEEISTEKEISDTKSAANDAIQSSAEDYMQTTCNVHADYMQSASKLHREVEVEVEVEVEEEKRENARERARARTSKQHDAHIESPLPAKRKVHFKSPHFGPRDFVNGYVPALQGTNPVQVYYERFSINNDTARLSAPLEDDLFYQCKDLDKLREVITAYSQCSYRPGNVKLILDWYQGGIPEKFKQRTENASSLPSKGAARNLAALDRFEALHGDKEITFQ